MASAAIGGGTIRQRVDDMLAFDDSGLLHLECMREGAKEPHHF